MVSKNEFLDCKEKSRFQKIKPGNLVWEGVYWKRRASYHPAVVKCINVDENYVDVIDVSDENREKRYDNFLTESELIQQTGISKDLIEEEYKKYRGIIEKVLR